MLTLKHLKKVLKVYLKMIKSGEINEIADVRLANTPTFFRKNRQNISAAPKGIYLWPLFLNSNQQLETRLENIKVLPITLLLTSRGW